MSIKEKIIDFYKQLNEYYPKKIIFLEFKNNFQTLISVILSAQTTDRQVNLIMEPLFSKYPDALALSQAKAGEVEAIIKPCGFFKVKASHIINSAKKLLEDFDGKVPSNMKDLLLLNGVGRKTANVVLGHCYHQPAIIVDTHFGRVVRRLGLTVQTNPDLVEKDIVNLLEPHYHYRFSMTANNHGRVFCHSRKPDCQNCFMKKTCPTFLGEI